MDLIAQFIDIFLHLDKHLVEWANQFGLWLNAILFAVVFCETGLVVTPFLPGDSLLFAVGALTALPGSPLEIWSVMVLLIVAGVLGDAVNYAIGRRIGPAVFKREDSWLLNKRHLERTHAFYEKHGGKTIIFARFIPIIRTFAPFVAGVGTMGYRRFASFNVIGAVAWVLSFTLAGHFFGQMPAVKRNFQYVILAIIVISVIPVVVEFFRARADARKAEAPQA
ncbi:MAG: DedA family protein [Deltaproteobacteria bacterium]|nr:DedA family protein [Deltaproteobacteria bacterium]